MEGRGAFAGKLIRRLRWIKAPGFPKTRDVAHGSGMQKLRFWHCPGGLLHPGSSSRHPELIHLAAGQEHFIPERSEELYAALALYFLECLILLFVVLSPVPEGDF